VLARLKGLPFDGPRRLFDADHVRRLLAPVTLLAWVGLGADGLSSVSYGPEMGFRALGSRAFLAPWVALALVATIVLVSATYRRLLPLFPGGGGGYLVASKNLGPTAGILAGAALLGGYALTVALSVAAGVEAIFSFLPPGWQSAQLPVTWLLLVAITILDVRGVRGTVRVLAWIAGTFLVTHVGLLAWLLARHAPALPAALHGAASGPPLGPLALTAALLAACAAGSATLGGIEAISNGLPALDEPRVPTGQRATVAVATTLSLLVIGLMLAFLVTGVREPAADASLNATLWRSAVSGWQPGGLPLGSIVVAVTLLSEAALLWVAAQIGFVGGPQTLAAMAADQWLPKRLAHLSERLVVQNGILAMGMMSGAVLAWTGCHLGTLATVYAVNVLLGFTLTQAGMARHWWTAHGRGPGARHAGRHVLVAMVGTALTAVLLAATLVTRFHAGGLAALVVIAVLTALGFLVRAHYRHVHGMLRSLDEVLGNLPLGEPGTTPELATEGPTAVVLVEAYNGLGIHTLLSIQRMFPRHYRNYVFCSVGAIDAGRFKGVQDAAALEARVRGDLEKYVELARRMGAYAEYRCTTGTEVVSELETMCLDITREFRRTVVFAGQLVFQRENLLTRSFHHETAFAIQRRLQFRGVQVVILPIRVWDHVRAA
jgi:hypothetical protein